MTDEILKRIRNKTHCLKILLVNYAWENTVDGAPLRRLILDMLALCPPQKPLEDDTHTYSGEFLLALCNRQLERYRKDNHRQIRDLALKAGTYHQHHLCQIA